jgi:hypothetical protein
MATFLTTALHDGSGWVILACLTLFVGVVVGLYTPRGSEISSHPYAKGGDLWSLKRGMGSPIAHKGPGCGGPRIAAANCGWGWKPGDQFG